MATLKIRAIGNEQCIFYNTNGAKALYGMNDVQLLALLSESNGQKILRSGTFATVDGGLLKRAVVSVDAAAGATEIYVNNPWVFAPGDAIKLIGLPGDSNAVTLAAINDNTTTPVGVVVSVSSNNARQASKITLSALAVGDVVTINLDGALVSYTVKTTVLADETDAIVKVINTAKRRVPANRYIKVETNALVAGEILVTSTIDYQFIEFAGKVVDNAGVLKPASLKTSTSQGTGKLTLSAPLSAALVPGSKVGVTTQVPMGVFDKSYDLTSYYGSVDIESSAGVYNEAQLQAKCLPYLDGQIVALLPKLSYMTAQQALAASPVPASYVDGL